MKIQIKRQDQASLDQEINLVEYTFKEFYDETVLQSLIEIKTNQDATLNFRSGCKSGVCGSCAVMVNGVEKLACKTMVKNGDVLEPLRNAKVIRDLVIDLDYEQQRLTQAHAFLDDKSNDEVTIADEKAIDVQSNCILCQSCYSSCPVYEVNPDFIGPYALTRTLRYVNDKKENNIKKKIDAVQENGVWDCTLCGNCTMVCPQAIDPKMDIINLRNKSAQFGYTDPNMANMNMGFNADFGFNPNGF
ncbi:MAG: 2Fe-2S iron-sulfur cluster-binding protein [Campylobacterota bacterium]|nr:2Fe-2S iron-sulfur cluster-binding protein [Campylobacterota bacterium]